MDGWMDGRMDGWMDRRMDGWMDGQKYIHDSLSLACSQLNNTTSFISFFVVLFINFSLFHLFFFFHEIPPASRAVISVTSVASSTCRFVIYWSSYRCSYNFQFSAHCLCCKLLHFFWRTLCLMILKLILLIPSTHATGFSHTDICQF